jgi:hypothetical protein
MRTRKALVASLHFIGYPPVRRHAVANIEIPVAEETARALDDPRVRDAVGRLVDRMVRPDADDPLAIVLARTAKAAAAAGFTEEELRAELDAYNAERRS